MEDRSISLQAAIEVVLGVIPYDEYWKDQIVKAVNALPSIQTEEIIYCGECKHMMPNGRCTEFADYNIRPSASDYCSYGERKIMDETV